MAAGSEPLSIQFDRSSSCLTAYIAGEIDAATAPAFKEQLLDRSDPSVKEVWVDLSAVTYCDSSGLAAFVAVHRHVTAFGGRAMLYQPQEIVRKGLAVSGIDREIPVVGRRGRSTSPSQS